MSDPVVVTGCLEPIFGVAITPSIPCPRFPPNIFGLGNLLWELPCLSPDTDPNACHCALENIQTEIATGSDTRIYNALCRFRGVVEQRTYLNGAESGFWYVGGNYDTSGGDNYNVYQLTISDPPQSYFLNAGTSGLAYCNGIDYQQTIQLRSGSIVILSALSLDNLEVVNQDSSHNPISVLDNDPNNPILVQQPYDGQFIQMDILSLTPVSS